MMEGKWTYQTGPETECWSRWEEYETREEAIAQGREAAIEDGEECFCVGQLIPAAPPAPDAEDILERAMDELYNLVGEASDRWLPGEEQTQDLQQWLDAIWERWLLTHQLKDVCYQIVRVSSHVVEEAGGWLAGQEGNRSGNHECDRVRCARKIGKN